MARGGSQSLQMRNGPTPHTRLAARGAERAAHDRKTQSRRHKAVEGRLRVRHRVTVTVRREAGEEQVAPVHYDEGSANRIGPEPCVVGREAGGEASAGVRIGQPLSRERINWDADVCHERKAKRRCASTRAHIRSCVVEDPGMYVRSSTGNRETSTPGLNPGVSGPHREGDEPKPMMHGGEESDPAISHCEANERGRATGRGVRGAKGGGQGERGTGRYAPDTEPARRAPRPGPPAASCTLRRQHPRWEPDALIGPVRFCAGGAQQ